MPRKTDKLNIRIEPAYKKALQNAAELEHRSIANMIEVMVRERCEKARFTIGGEAPEKRKLEQPRKTNRAIKIRSDRS